MLSATLDALGRDIYKPAAYLVHYPTDMVGKIAKSNGLGNLLV